MLALSLLFITVGLTVALTVYRFQDSATLSGQQAAVDRQDCARRISNLQADVVRDRDSVGWLGLLIAFAGTEEEKAAFPPKLRAANQLVDNLPPLQDVVDRLCPEGPS